MPFFRYFPTASYSFPDPSVVSSITDIFRFVKVDAQFLDSISAYTYYLIHNGDRPDVVSTKIYGIPDYYWTFFVINDSLKSGLTGWPMSYLEFQTYMESEYDGTVLVTIPTTITNSFGLGDTYVNSLAGPTFIVGETVTGLTSGATGTVVSKDVQLSQLALTKVTGQFQANEYVRGTTSSYVVTPYQVFPRAYAPHHYEDPAGNVSYNALLINEINSSQGVQSLTPNVNDYPDAPNLTTVSNWDHETALNDARSTIRVLQPDVVYDFAKTYKTLIQK